MAVSTSDDTYQFQQTVSPEQPEAPEYAGDGMDAEEYDADTLYGDVGVDGAVEAMSDAYDTDDPLADQIADYLEAVEQYAAAMQDAQADIDLDAYMQTNAADTGEAAWRDVEDYLVPAEDQQFDGQQVYDTYLADDDETAEYRDIPIVKHSMPHGLFGFVNPHASNPVAHIDDSLYKRDEEQFLQLPLHEGKAHPMFPGKDETFIRYWAGTGDPDASISHNADKVGHQTSVEYDAAPSGSMHQLYGREADQQYT